MTYEHAKQTVFIFLAGYCCVGLLAHVANITHNTPEDLYPFFSWFLFVRVPSRVQFDYEARMSAGAGKSRENAGFLTADSGIVRADCGRGSRCLLESVRPICDR